jgi:hypothetical protein
VIADQSGPRAATLATTWSVVFAASHSRLEHIMFASIAQKLKTLFMSTEDQERDAYLASSVDFVDLEYRLHMLEMSHQPYSLYSSGAPRERQL